MQINHYCRMFDQYVKLDSQAKRPGDGLTPKNTILFLPWGGYGDILLATGTLKKLRQYHPKAKIYCLNRKKMQEILQHNPHIDRFIPFPHKLFPKKNLQLAMNNPEADPMICYSAYGYFKPSENYPLRHAISVIGDMVGVEAELNDMRVYFSHAETEFARQFKNEMVKPFVLLQITPLSHPGKAWSNERWAEVVKFLDSQGMTTMQVGLSDEELIAGAVSLLGKTTILQALALLKEAVFFLGIDSVFQHAAYALGVPALVLFGASTPAVWGYPAHINLYSDLPCQPCTDEHPQTCQEHRCMLKISTDEVIDEARKLL